MWHGLILKEVYFPLPNSSIYTSSMLSKQAPHLHSHHDRFHSDEASERIIFWRNLDAKEIADNRHFLDDIFAYPRYFSEEEERKDAGGDAEHACCHTTVAIVSITAYSSLSTLEAGRKGRVEDGRWKLGGPDVQLRGPVETYAVEVWSYVVSAEFVHQHLLKLWTDEEK
jgi:hypothetical protein